MCHVLATDSEHQNVQGSPSPTKHIFCSFIDSWVTIFNPTNQRITVNIVAKRHSSFEAVFQGNP